MRKAFEKAFGDDWIARAAAGEIYRVQEVALASCIYDELFSHLLGWDSPAEKPRYKPHAIVHITGGGIPSKFGDLLFARGLSAELDSLYEPPPAMQWAAETLDTMKPSEHYQVWNGGQGMLLVVDQSAVNSVIAAATDRGIYAKYCGHITQESSPVLAIKSQFTGDLLEYRPAA